MVAIIPTTVERLLQPNNSSSNNNKQQQQDLLRFLVTIASVIILWQRFLAINAQIQLRYLVIAKLWQRFLVTIATVVILLQRFHVLNVSNLWQRFLVLHAKILWQRFLATIAIVILWLKWNVLIIGMTVGTTTAGIIVIGTRVTLVTLLVASVLQYMILQLWLSISSNSSGESSRLFNDNFLILINKINLIFQNFFLQ